MIPQELRIGNWVIGKNTGQELQVVAGDFMGNWRNFIPITLTEERLERFGFVILGTKLETHGVAKKDNKFELSLWQQEDESWHIEYSHYNHRVLIKHVHQLQNLYHSLTGEELEINRK